MRELPAGDDAVLLDFSADGADAATRAAGLLRAAALRGELRLTDVIPAAATVLVQAAPGEPLDVLAVRRVLRAAARTGPEPAAAAAPTLTVPVAYDGADLTEAAGLAGVAVADVIGAHTAITWRVQFMGFAPGFGYLVPAPGSPAAAVELLAPIGRRAQARPAVPAGAVAVAAGYTAVYPRTGPGGWFLLGRSEIELWNADARPPALFAPGAAVRFTCAD
jgi:KipI family sensor histidine kinase inhibitor